MWFMGPGEPHKPVFSEYQNFDDFGKVGIDGIQILVIFFGDFAKTPISHLKPLFPISN